MTFYETSRPKIKWLRCNSSRHCPICQRQKYCSISADGAVCFCTKVEQGSFKRSSNNDGWLHRLDGTVRVPSAPAAPEPQKLSRHELELLQTRYSTSVNPTRLKRFAGQLGLTVESLNLIGIGWLDDREVWSFPMRLADGSVCGFRLRAAGGKKFALPGSREGLVVPWHDNDRLRDNPLVICEGPTDCAAALDMGLNAVGRPSCSGGVRLILELVERIRPQQVVIIADADAPGRAGAADLAWRLTSRVGEVKTITPPTDVKDVRGWLNAGACSLDVFLAVEAVRPEPLRIAPPPRLSGEVRS